MISEQGQSFARSTEKRTDYGFAKVWCKHIEIECSNQVNKISCVKLQEKIIHYIKMIEDEVLILLITKFNITF